MYVIMDLEWIETADGHASLTQLAALRVDAGWNAMELFSAVLCPGALAQCDPGHIALNGYPLEAFARGETEENAIRRLAAWLRDDDVIAVWHPSSKNVLAQAWRAVMASGVPCPILCIKNRVYNAVGRRPDGSGSLYAVAGALGIAAAPPQHCSKEDVALMRAIFQRVGLPQRAPGPEPGGKEFLPPQERNRAIIEKTQYRYLYTPASGVFHTRDCPRMLNARKIEGCVYYATAVRKRRPCRICSPKPDAESAQKAQQAENGQDKGHAESKVHYREVIRTRVLGGEIMEIARGKIAGYCHNIIHPGHVTRALLREHDCLGKQCTFFQKYEDSPVWAALEQQRLAKARVKQRKKAEKARLTAHAEAMAQLRREFQQCADSTQSEMDVIRVEHPEPNIYTVFYVSDNPFADGNRFPRFLSAVLRRHPHCRITLRHIMDLENRFLTRDEYQALHK